jgi:hypothetical protein
MFEMVGRDMDLIITHCIRVLKYHTVLCKLYNYYVSIKSNLRTLKMEIPRVLVKFISDT